MARLSRTQQEHIVSDFGGDTARERVLRLLAHQIGMTAMGVRIVDCVNKKTILTGACPYCEHIARKLGVLNA